MDPPVVMRALVLAAVALLAVVATLATRNARNADARSKEPAPVAWYKARAAPYGQPGCSVFPTESRFQRDLFPTVAARETTPEQPLQAERRRS